MKRYLMINVNGNIEFRNNKYVEIKLTDEEIQKTGGYQISKDIIHKDFIDTCPYCGGNLMFQYKRYHKNKNDNRKFNYIYFLGCENDKCETRNNAKHFRKAFWSKEELEQFYERAKYVHTKEYLIKEKGYTEEEAENKINKRNSRIANIGKSFKGIKHIDRLIEKGYSEEEAKEILRSYSHFSKAFYLKRGYSEEEATKIVSEIQKRNASKVKKYSHMTREYMLEHGYTAEELDKMYSERSVFSKAFYLKRGYSEEEATKIVSEIQKRNSSKVKNNSRITGSIRRIEYYLKRGYSEEEAIKLLKKAQTTFSKDICIQKYNNEEGIKIFNERQAKWQKSLHENGNMSVGFSKVSQELFDVLFKYAINKDSIKYASHNKEISFYNKVTKRSVQCDFCDVSTKKIIEFQGDLYHANPKLFKPTDKPHPFSDLTSSEIWEKDKIKENLIKENGYDVYYVWENDYKTNPEMVINECLKYLGYDK